MRDMIKTSAMKIVVLDSRILSNILKKMIKLVKPIQSMGFGGPSPDLILALCLEGTEYICPQVLDHVIYRFKICISTYLKLSKKKIRM